MEASTSEVGPQQQQNIAATQENIDNLNISTCNEEIIEQIEENKEQQSLSVIKDEKNSDSDANSEDFTSNDDQNNVNSGSSSQLYESSDSKVDYAVKIDDNDTLSDIDDIKTDTASADSEDSALGSLPPDTALNDREEEVQDRSDGSDSGIGSETPEELKLPSFNIALPCSSGLENVEQCDIMKKNDEECIKNNNDAKQNYDLNVPAQTKEPSKSNLKRKIEGENIDGPQGKRKKENIKFDSVTVYYFPRAQGFSCVPSQGGSTLGMEWEHSHTQKFSLVEHAMEQRRLHKQILQQLKSERHSLQGAALSSSEDSDTEEETSDISESELDLDSYYFLQPVTTRQRRALLRAAGVRKIEGFEKDECRDIRTSREFCGCACKGTCNPENCSCSLAGIKCQVDRLNFPCGCTREGCSNTTGRIEFNPVRVRTHFIQTLMRIGLEKKNEENQEAVKRHWVTHNTNTQPCVPNSTYERNQCIGQNERLLRDVNLTPKVEVESCVNNGNFNNVHCDMVNANIQNMQDNISYAYRNEAPSQKNVNDNNVMRFEDNSHHNHSEAYTSNIFQGKGPPFIHNNSMAFQTMPDNMQRFNYTYEQHSQHTDHIQYKGQQSYSATSFEEFAHNSQMSMFSHYGHIYVPDYLHKPSPSMHEHSTFHAMPQNHYDMYKNTVESVDTENKNDSHYTTLMTLPYQSNNKLQNVENDENWFSQNTLIGLDHTEPTNQATPVVHAEPAEETSESNVPEATENFGELIKKTMVESVIV